MCVVEVCKRWVLQHGLNLSNRLRGDRLIDDLHKSDGADSTIKIFHVSPYMFSGSAFHIFKKYKSDGVDSMTFFCHFDHLFLLESTLHTITIQLQCSYIVATKHLYSTGHIGVSSGQDVKEIKSTNNKLCLSGESEYAR